MGFFFSNLLFFSCCQVKKRGRRASIRRETSRVLNDIIWDVPWVIPAKSEGLRNASFTPSPHFRPNLLQPQPFQHKENLISTTKPSDTADLKKYINVTDRYHQHSINIRTKLAAPEQEELKATTHIQLYTYQL